MVTNAWASRQVDFVLAFPQADIECEMYMEVPQGFHVEGSRKDHTLKLDKNLYGQKQAGGVWNLFMHNGLLARGFQQSSIDMCVIYVDDGIFLAPDQDQIQRAFSDMAKDCTDSAGKVHRAFRITDEGDLADYLGNKIESLAN
jgi:Reverse transcriptase (RNA-dependent DNA polymerase)